MIGRTVPRTAGTARRNACSTPGTIELPQEVQIGSCWDDPFGGCALSRFGDVDDVRTTGESEMLTYPDVMIFLYDDSIPSRTPPG